MLHPPVRQWDRGNKTRAMRHLQRCSGNELKEEGLFQRAPADYRYEVISRNERFVWTILLGNVRLFSLVPV